MCNKYFVVRFTWFWFWQCTLCIQLRGNTYTKCMVSLFQLRLLCVQVRHVTDRWLTVAYRPAIFFFCKRGLPSPNISANHMARILSTSYVHVHTRTVNVCAMLMISYVILKYAPYDWLKCNPRLQKKKNRARARCTWSVCSRLRLLRVQVRHVTDRWLAVAYRRGLPSWARAAIFFSANEDCHPPIFQPIIWRVF